MSHVAIIRVKVVNLHCRIDVDRSIYRGGRSRAWRPPPGRGLASSSGRAAVGASACRGGLSRHLPGAAAGHNVVTVEQTTPIGGPRNEDEKTHFSGA
jgi:hypothetical protein